MFLIKLQNQESKYKASTLENLSVIKFFTSFPVIPSLNENCFQKIVIALCTVIFYRWLNHSPRDFRPFTWFSVKAERDQYKEVGGGGGAKESCLPMGGGGK